MSETKPRILIVDDERFNRNVLADLLKPNYTVVLAKSGQQAIEKAAADKRPDLILLDIMMPEMDGYEVCRRLKADPHTAEIPIIFVTAMQETEDERKGLEAGAIDYIAKPFSPAIVDARVRNHIALNEARRKVELARGKLSALLNNSGQGFLSFSENLAVDSEYSRECERIFQGPVAGQRADALLFPDDVAQQQLFAKNISRILEEPDEYIRDLYLSLLPRDLVINSRNYLAAHRMAAHNRVMVILTDITHERRLESVVQQERNRLAFIVSAVRDADDFFDTLSEFDGFLDKAAMQLAPEAAATLTDEQQHELYGELFRKAHTFKGLFAQFDFIHLPERLHVLEQALANQEQASDDSSASLLDSPDVEAMREAFLNADCRTALERDKAVLIEALGEDFFERKGKMTISKTQAAVLERLAASLLSERRELFDPETSRLLEDFTRIRHVPARALLDSYPKMAWKLAERLGKAIEPFEVEGDHVMVHPDEYGAFFRSLVHVFRNAVDHGLETPDERVGAGKPEQGVLRCVVMAGEEAFSVRISDDGRGVDLERVRERLGAAAEKLSDEELVRCIFHDALSTCADVTEVSGRGVGLASVWRELNALGGSVAVENRPGQGLQLDFTLPLRRSGSAESEKRGA